MVSSQNNQPTFLSVAPRFVVQNMEQALAFYRQLGFRNLILFAESISKEEASAAQEG